MTKKISIVTPCYNEGENVEELCERIKDTMSSCDYEYEHILIDNCSTDDTVLKIKKIRNIDSNVKLIVNSRNFGHIRSPYHGLMQSEGDAVVLMAADLQDPPELIKEFILKWEEGYKIVMAVKPESEESFIIFSLRKLYYRLVTKMAEVDLEQNATGAGLYDRKIIEHMRKIGDPYPYFRGLVCEIGYKRATVEFIQPKRKRGITSNNFYSLYDIAMLGITSHSKVPLRILTIIGFVTAFFSFLFSILYLLAKILFWSSFDVGVAPTVIAVLFLGSIQMLSIGIIGEYIGSIHTHIKNHPHVIESERVNFK